jgi:hypothetical protein
LVRPDYEFVRFARIDDVEAGPEKALRECLRQERSGGGVASGDVRLTRDHRSDFGAQRCVALGLIGGYFDARGLSQQVRFALRYFNAPDAFSAVICAWRSLDAAPFGLPNFLPTTTETPTIASVTKTIAIQKPVMAISLPPT